MSINTQSDIVADLQIGATDQGMVRLFVIANDGQGEIEIPMDFAPEDAQEILEELSIAIKQANAMS